MSIHDKYHIIRKSEQLREIEIAIDEVKRKLSVKDFLLE